MTESDSFDLISKMDPMARRALASLEAVQAAIKTNDTTTIGKHLLDAENAIQHLKSDLDLADRLSKMMSNNSTPAAEPRMGVLAQYDNTASDYKGSEGAIALGVSRVGRATGFFTPHRVI